MQYISLCPVCGNDSFKQQDILWPDLIHEWGLEAEEVDYINRQQGLTCTACACNLRSMALAEAIMRCYNYRGTFKDFTEKNSPSIKALEINEAGHLTPFLSHLSHHLLASYPDVDIMQLPYKNNSFDLIVHSDTLEHVKNPMSALRETLRVLKPGGFTCFTVPIVVGRLTQKRVGKPESYHGTPGEVEYLVCTEYGSNVWTQVMEAGFDECRLISIDYPASIAVVGVKESQYL